MPSMQNGNNLYRIYSRKRLNIFGRRKFKNKKIERKVKTTRPIFVVFIVAFIVCFFIWNSINPVFDELCIEEAKVIATKITNEKATKVLEKYEYKDLFKIEKDDAGELQMVVGNVLVMNKITSDIAIDVQEAIENYKEGSVKLPLGIISGNKFLSGSLPDIKIKLATAGNVITDIKSEFIAQSTNQTLHRVYLQIDCNINILTPYNVTKAGIQNQVLLLENVIVGDFGTYGGFPLVNNR